MAEVVDRAKIVKGYIRLVSACSVACGSFQSIIIAAKGDSLMIAIPSQVEADSKQKAVYNMMIDVKDPIIIRKLEQRMNYSR